MKKNLLFTIFVFVASVCAMTLSAQCEMHVKVTVQDATCYDNGVVRFQLTDGSGNPITAEAGGLSNTRCYYIEQGSKQKRYSDIGVDTIKLEADTYTVGYEALCSDGDGGWRLQDTSTLITVKSAYTVPTASAIYTTSTTLDGFGRWPTLSCTTTGRIQLKIEGGRFPYSVTRKAHGSEDPIETVVFDSYQYVDPISGDPLNISDLTRYDYKDYYTFDNLPAGDWDFYVVDGCGYGLPRTGQVVETINFPKLSEVSVLKGNSADSNIVLVKASLDKSYAQYNYLLPQWVKYRFVNGDMGNTEWRPFPYTETNSATLYDTITADKYGDIFNKNLSLEYEFTSCGATSVSKDFNITTPTVFYKDFSDKRDSSFEDASVKCMDKWYWHRDWYSIFMRPFDYNAHNQLYYTCPLTWVYTDKTTGNIIKRDTINNPSGISYLTAEDVAAYYGSFRETDRNISLNRKLVDAKGSVLYSTDDAVSFIYRIGEQIVDWDIDRSSDEDHCCTYRRWIKVYEHHHSTESQDGNIIRLKTSPYGNRYNFEAVYSATTLRWTVTKNNLENMAEIEGDPSGRSLTIYDYCLPSGPYVFEILTSCDTVSITKNFSFPDRYSVEVTEPITFSRTQKCTDQYLKPVSGEISWVRRNTSSETGLENEPIITPLPSTFQIIKGPIGGYDDRHFSMGDSIRISMPGTFVIRYGTNDNYTDYCGEQFVYDTIYYDGATIEFDYEYALLCDSTQTSGNVYVKGKNGTPPYTYTLYSGPDETGSVLASNHDGTFEDINYTIRDVLSCRLEDDCGAYFHVNITPLSLADAQKTWFDNGLSVLSTCEGSTISVHALSVENIFNYSWTGPNGFSSTSSDPEVFIPRDMVGGWYKVTMTTNSCIGSFSDSVQLNVLESPSLTIYKDSLVCPGTAVDVSFTPHSPNGADSVRYVVAAMNDFGTTYYEMIGKSDMTQTLPFVASSPTRIYAVAIDDSTCTYTLADDTVKITLKGNVASSCNILTSDTTVCYNTDAVLHAKSTLNAPYTLKWYADYSLTNLLQEDLITSNSRWADYDTAGIRKHTELFVTVEKDGFCPTVYGVPTHTVNMADATATLHCGETYRLYDSGGNDKDYTPGESLKYFFGSDNGDRLTLKFNYFDLAEGSLLHVISGDDLVIDSVLYTLRSDSDIPDIITSNSDKLTLWFISSQHPAAKGWSANVEHRPAIATADAWNLNHVMLQDAVCQNQSGNYDDPYGAKTWSTDIANAIVENVKKAGHYTYEITFPGVDIHGCDSTVSLNLSVEAPPHHDTSATMVDILGPFTWDKTGETYTESGLYSKLYTTPDGCDSLDLLYLTLIEVDTSTNNICVGDTTLMYITAKIAPQVWKNDLVPDRHNIGDVLLDDGNIVSVKKYNLNPSAYAAPKGIVFHLDSTGQHGWAVALTDAYDTSCVWARSASNVYRNVHSMRIYENNEEALLDTNGRNNTLEIKRTALAASGNDFALNAPAAYYCYYYDHITGTTGENPKGWYLPACAQAEALYLNKIAIYRTLSSLSYEKCMPFKDNYAYWTSTERDHYQVNLQQSAGGSGTYRSDMYRVSNPGSNFIASPTGGFYVVQTTLFCGVRAVCNF